MLLSLYSGGCDGWAPWWPGFLSELVGVNVVIYQDSSLPLRIARGQEDSLKSDGLMSRQIKNKGAVKKCLNISSQPLFHFGYRLRKLPKITVSCSPHCHLERSCMSIWEQRYLALLRLWVERSPPQYGLCHWEREISPLCGDSAWSLQVSRSWPLACPIRGFPIGGWPASVEMTMKRGECLRQFVPCRPMIRRLPPGCLTIW